MSRLTILDNEHLPAETREQVEALDKAGQSSTVQRVLAHRPDMFDSYFRFYFPMHNEGIVSPALKELVRLKIASLNQCLT